MAASAAWNTTCHSARRPPAIARLPRIVPLSFGTGASPIMAAAPPDAIRPSSGLSAISMAAETAPIPGMDRRCLAFAAEFSSCVNTLSIRRSSSLILGPPKRPRMRPTGQQKTRTIHTMEPRDSSNAHFVAHATILSGSTGGTFQMCIVVHAQRDPTT